MSEPLAWYSEIDPKAAATLRELIKQGHIAPGVVDERSIEDVSPVELIGYTQRHYFAGGGVWSYALRAGGWPDHWPVVTGSCPCQPFSSAGKGKGFADERHLWPSFHWHLRFGEPVPVFGEQVASKDGLTWLDSVSADLEGSGYQIGATDTCAAGFGAPHIRQRLYWMAYPGYAMQGWRAVEGSSLWAPCDESSPHGSTHRLADASREDGERGCPRPREEAGGWPRSGSSGSSLACRLESSNRSGGDRRTRGGEQPLCDERSGKFIGLAQPELPERRPQAEGRQDGFQGQNTRGEEAAGGRCMGGRAGGMGSPIPARLQGQPRHGDDSNEPGRIDALTIGSVATPSATDGLEHAQGDGRGQWGSESGWRRSERRCGADTPRTGPTNGFWRNPDWLLCRDDWWRPVEAGTFPLAHGAAERMGRLRMYGNAIVAPQAAIFVEAAIEELKERGVIG